MSMTETETGTLAFVASASTRPARSFASASKSMSCLLPSIQSCERVNWNLPTRTDWRLAPEFSYVESQAVFYIAWLVKALVEELLESCLRGGAGDRVNACIPSRGDFDVGRQAGSVYEALGVADGPLFEGADPRGERINKGVEFGVRERAIHVAVQFSEIAADVLRA